MLRKSPLFLAVVLTLFVSCVTSNHRDLYRDQIILVKVKKNDTLNIIAKRHRTTWQSIASLNRDKLSNGLREGQELRIRTQIIPSSVSGNDARNNDDDQGEDFLPSRKSGFLFFRRSNKPPELEVPTPGRISSYFGKRGRKLHKGVDIVAMVGSPIVASADGEVIFSGRQRGYGSTIVIDHGEFMTLYAHASKLIARRGDRVRRGDFIAKVGRTGNARGAHLHFELRDRQNKPLDPVQYFTGANVASLQVSKKRRLTANSSALKVRRKSQGQSKSSVAKSEREPTSKKRLLYARD
jgi:murein DD-endopeptidase MepM/ murein hydrolase activator NlpD